MYRMGKARSAFWPGRDTGGEPASCTGGREHSVTLWAPCVTRLCLRVSNKYSGVAAEFALDLKLDVAEVKRRWHS
jgi:hypothetical protein